MIATFTKQAGKSLYTLFFLGFLFANVASANPLDIMPTVEAPFGIGGSIRYQVLPRVFVALSKNSFGGSLVAKMKDTKINIDYKLSAISLGFDIHPFYNGFFIGLGGRFNDHYADGATPSDGVDVVIKGIQYKLPQDSSIHSKLSYNQVGPYIRLGYQNISDSFGLSFSLGLSYMGRPKIETAARGDLRGIVDSGNTPVSEDRFRDIVKNGLDSFNKDVLERIESLPGKGRIWPTLSLGFFIRF